MHDQSDILISVHGRFVDGMLSGTKRVELRRRTPKISAGTRLWIYNTAPVAAVTAMAVLDKVQTLPPDMLWREYHSVLDLSFSEFERYVAGRTEVAALCLRSVHALRPVSLGQMRQVDPKLHPPQFYLRLNNPSALLDILERSIFQE